MYMYLFIYLLNIFLSSVEHTDKITVLQCCPVQYKVELCNKKIVTKKS